jgi:hypothetical protein
MYQELSVAEDKIEERFAAGGAAILAQPRNRSGIIQCTLFTKNGYHTSPPHRDS